MSVSVHSAFPGIARLRRFSGARKAWCSLSLSGSVSLFDGPWELLNLAFPVLFLAACVFEMVLSARIFWENADLVKFAQSVIFFDSIHVVFSYFIVGCTSYGRKWLQSIVAELGRGVIYRGIAVMIGYAIVMYVFQTKILHGHFVHGLLAVVLGLVFRHHNITQSRGLSFAYETKARERLSSVTPKGDLFRLERIIFDLLLFVTVIQIVKKFRGPFMVATTTPLIALCLGIIFWRAFRSTPAARVKRVIFSLRFVVKALVPFSGLAAYGFGAIHGMEYLCCFSKLTKKREKLLIGATAFFLFVCLAMVTLAVLMHPNLLLPGVLGEARTKGLASIAMSGAYAIVFGHFYMDHFLFSARYRAAKTVMLPELIATHE